MTKNYQGTSIKLNCLKTNDLRTLNFYLRALAADYINIPKPQRGYYTLPAYPLAPLTNSAQIKKEITTALIPFDSHDLKNIDDDFTVFEAINLIPSEQFNWLKESQVACMYIWQYITRRRPLSRLVWYQNDRYFTYTLPISHNERYQNIIDYFDYSFLDDSRQRSKQEVLDLLKANWLETSKNTPSLSWLNHTVTATDDAIEWTQDYIMNYNHSHLQSPTGRSQDIELLEATTREEQRLSIIVALQHWQTHHDTKHLFYQRIRRAWSQRNSRKSRENMKAVNTYIDIRAKEKLDRLSKFNRVRMNEMLEIMIEDQYERQKTELEERYGKIGSLK